MMPCEYPRTETTSDHWIELARLADGLAILADVATHHSDNIRVAAAWVDRGGDPVSEGILDRIRDELGEAHRAFIAAHLKEARITAKALRAEHEALRAKGAAA